MTVRVSRTLAAKSAIGAASLAAIILVAHAATPTPPSKAELPPKGKPLAQTASHPGPRPTYPIANGYFQALQWRGIGPYRGGRALAVAGIPGDPSTFYFGAVAGGVWRTTDGGATWQPLTDKTPISSVGAIAIAPSNRNII